MGLVENEAFLLELTRLFQKSRSKGTGAVRICMKRYDGRTKPIPGKPNPAKDKKKKKKNPNDKRPPPVTTTAGGSGDAGPSEYTCLHAKLGNTKVSSIVHSKDVNKFQLAYCSVLKGNMDSFKKYRKKPGAAGAAISSNQENVAKKPAQKA